MVLKNVEKDNEKLYHDRLQEPLTDRGLPQDSPPDYMPEMKPDQPPEPTGDELLEPEDKEAGSREAPPAPAPGAPVEVVARDPLQLYLREISRFPLLGPEEEFELARRLREKNDQDAAFRLVSSHLRLVVKIAMDFHGRWMQNVLDLIQEGNVGLMKAVRKFDPDKGDQVQLLRGVLDQGLHPQVHHGQLADGQDRDHPGPRKLFYNLNKERQRLQSMGFDPTPRPCPRA